MAAKWTTADIPLLTGKVAIVTGANSGLGLETSAALAAAGARVVMACRNAERGRAALDEVRRRTAAAQAELAELDLSSLSSVRAFAKAVAARHARLDVLCNNAGLMMVPKGKTVDGFETVFGTNHLGPFALTGLLIERITGTRDARVVTLSSLTHRNATLPFDDLNWERRPYSKAGAYGQSKLANLVFALEFERRLRRARINAISIAAHPGYSATNIAFGGVRAPVSLAARVWHAVVGLGNALMAQPAALGVLPTLYAATAPEVQGGDYIGPDGFGELRGYPGKARARPLSRDPEVGARLWAVSEQLTGVRYLS